MRVAFIVYFLKTSSTSWFKDYIVKLSHNMEHNKDNNNNKGA